MSFSVSSSLGVSGPELKRRLVRHKLCRRTNTRPWHLLCLHNVL